MALAILPEDLGGDAAADAHRGEGAIFWPAMTYCAREALNKSAIAMLWKTWFWSILRQRWMVETTVAKQQTFAGLAWQNKGKQTRRERFLAEMDAIIPWAQLLELIEPHYPKAGNGRPPLGLEKMLRIYFLQIWFNLSDPGAEEALYDSESMRRFARIELSFDKVPDESTILNFRHLLEEHDLTKAMFERINGLMEQKGLLLRAGTIVDATIIAAPSSTKNATESRDPEMKQTKKGNNWHFGMKVHVGTDRRGVVHSLTATHAATADIIEMNALLHGQERTIFGDQAYWKEADRQRFRAAGVRYRVNRRGTAQRPLTEHQKKINQSRSRTRARGEHAFRIVKQLWGFAKVRYRGIAKNAARAFTSFALANLYLMRRWISPYQAWCL
jgi:IS5 family transposase